MKFNKLDILTKLKLAADLSGLMTVNQLHPFNNGIQSNNSAGGIKRFGILREHGITSLSLYHGDNTPLTISKNGNSAHHTPWGMRPATSINFSNSPKGVILSFNSDMGEDEISSTGLGLSSGTVSGTVVIGDDIRASLKHAMDFLDIFTVSVTNKEDECTNLILGVLAGLDKAEALPDDIIKLVSKAGSLRDTFSAISGLISSRNYYHGRDDHDEESNPSQVSFIIRGVGPFGFDVSHNYPANHSLDVRYMETAGEDTGELKVSCMFNSTQPIELFVTEVSLNLDTSDFVDVLIKAIDAGKLNTELGTNIVALADYATKQLEECKPFIEGALKSRRNTFHQTPHSFR